MNRRWAEAGLGLTQVAGQFIGSTTLTGAWIYEGVTVGWWVWMLTGRMWGFLPINVAGLAISTYALWRLYL